MLVETTFSLNARGTEDNDLVLRTGKLFEAGDYPDKGFSVTEEELAKAVAEFKPVDNDLEHTPTVLDGKLGQLRSVEQRGKDMWGTVAIPKWLDSLVGNKPLAASLAWLKKTKKIVGNALVLNPRIPDAQLVAAFSAAYSTKKGDDTMPQLVQFKALFAQLLDAGKKADDITEEDIKALFADDAKTTSVDDKTTDDTPPNGDKKTDKVVDTPVDDKPTFSITGTDVRLLQHEAEAWFRTELEAGHVFPTEKDGLTKQYVLAAQDDAREAKVALFSDKGDLFTGERVKVMCAAVAARPKHVLFGEHVDGNTDGEVVVLANTKKDAADQPMTDKRRQELLSKGRIRVPVKK